MPGGEVLARFYRPGGSGGFELLFCPGVGIHPSKKLPGEWSGLELIDTLTLCWTGVRAHPILDGRGKMPPQVNSAI